MRVLLVDDHRLLLEGLSNLLEAHQIPVAGMARDGLEAVQMARSLHPDVILMDIRMPRCNGLCATRLIKSEMPEIKIIVLTTSTEEHDLFEAVKSGACGYLLKSMDANELVESLALVQEGIPPFSPGLAVKLLDEFARIAETRGGGDAEKREPSDAEKGGHGDTEREERLTERQRGVLRLVAQGLSYKEVGAKLSLSPRTVKYHMAEIMNLLHLEHRAQVLAYAGKMGMTKD